MLDFGRRKTKIKASLSSQAGGQPEALRVVQVDACRPVDDLEIFEVHAVSSEQFLELFLGNRHFPLHFSYDKKWRR